MSSTGEFPAIVTEIGGVQMRLVTPNQLRNAVTRKLVEPSTLIVYETSASQSEEIFAGECELLIPIFEKEGIAPAAPLPTGSPTVPPTAASPEPSKEEESDPAETALPAEDDKATTGDATQSAKQPWGEPDESAAEEPVVERVEDNTGRDEATGSPPVGGDEGDSGEDEDGTDGGPAWRTPLLIGLAIAAFFAAYASGSFSEPAEPEPESRAYFAVSDLNVRGEPSGESEKLGMLERNDEIAGYRLEENPNWVKVTSQQHKGGYLSYKYLSETRRPFLEKATWETFRTVQNGSVYISPDVGSDIVALLDFPSEVVVRGSISSEFAEVFNSEWDTPVAYVEWNAFGGENGIGDPREIRVINNCSTTKNFTLSYFESGRNRRVDTFWEYRPNLRSFARNDFKRIKTTSSEIYYFDLGSGFHLLNRRTVRWTSKDNLRVNGVAKKASRATPRAAGPGTYEITFCGGN
ncbi:MAG: hypothetical protein AAGA34_04430 [Pseudomonadota bacterium]